MNSHHISRWAGSALIVLGTISLAAGLYLQLTPKLYRATVRIAVEKNDSDTTADEFPGKNPGAGFDPFWMQSEFEAPQSKATLYRVITNLNLNRKWAERIHEGSELRTEVTYRLMKQQLDVRQLRSTSLIEIR